MSHWLIFHLFADSVPPVIRFVNAPSVTNNNPRFTWSSSEQAVFECSFNGEEYETCGNGLEGNWSKNNVRNGRYVLLVRGRDSAGNLGRRTTHTWTVGKISNYSVIS